MTTAAVTPLLRCLRRAVGEPDHDGKLLDQFRNGRDEAAFSELVARHAEMVYGVCLRVLGNSHDAEDAFQAVFVVLVRRAGELTGRDAIGGWLHGVARRTALKARASAMRRRSKVAAAGARAATAVDAKGEDAVELLDAELASLPEKYREPLVLCELEGWPREKVASALRVPVGTLSSRLATGKRMLADRLRRRGFMAVPGLFAADTTVPPGLVGAAVLAATREAPVAVANLAGIVTKAMVLTKLTAGAAMATLALLLGVGAAMLSPASAEAPGTPKVSAPHVEPGTGRLTARQLQEREKVAMDALRGTWMLQRTLVNGKEQENQFEYYRWRIDGRNVKVEHKKVDGEAFTGESTATVNPTKVPAQMNVHGKGVLLLAIYRQDGDRLKVAFLGRSEVERPCSFDPRQTRVEGMPLIVWELKRRK